MGKNMERGICIYPAYINKKKSVAEGRRITKVVAVENPLTSEILAVCKDAKLATLPEDKVYPRELFKFDPACRGRVKVLIKNTDGTLCNEKLPNKKALMLYIATMIPKLKSRTQKSSASGSQTSSQQSNQGQSKKKNRKKGRR